MNIIDLSHPMENGMPTYPGDEPASFELLNSHEKDGYQVMKIKAITHSGTHLDAPAHLIADGATIDKMPVLKFYGKGVVLDCSAVEQNSEIGLKYFIQNEKHIANADFVLVYTGWNKYWGNNKYYADYPVISTNSAIYLLKFNLKGIGLDTPSVDSVTATNYPNHNLFLRKGLILIENLTNLQELINKTFDFATFPCNIKNGDGCPVRAVGILSEGG
jgi:arylformamidase